MRKRVKTKVITLLMLLPLVLTACGGEMDPALIKLQGHWVDVNSDATLDITGATMRFTSGGWREKYPFLVETTVYGTTLVPPKGKDFGPMSEITIGEDGSLTAYEQVLDAEGHQYHFVREADKAAYLEIKDFSQDLPKTIESRDMKEFSLTFAKDYEGEYGLDSFWPCGRYSWTIDKQENDWWMEFSVSGDSYVILQFSTTVDQAWMEGLAALLESTGAIEENGYYQKNEVARHSWSLWVKYASGESVVLRAEGDAAAACVFDLPALMEYAKTMDEVKFWQ